MLLEGARYQVDTASSGTEAWKRRIGALHGFFSSDDEGQQGGDRNRQKAGGRPGTSEIPAFS
jgi:hypothetical protein